MYRSDYPDDPNGGGESHVLVNDTRGWTEAERAVKEADLREELPGYDELGASVTVASDFGIEDCLMCFRFRRRLSDYQRHRLKQWIWRDADALN
ncbi:hypothetical protein [Enhydrobacter sp.]|jgi:hypothetical protein|uniref:hypothetical protein n=1 Tax=Enhydrobacter sp. TaxID=1894999 RepID=UPI00261D1F83|nr:hypothetical protein [Enhydrobacter sp.]WIM10729.1 MAG: hypothetical protein OJF58_001685 [Enhydrobacter sp.]